MNKRLILTKADLERLSPRARAQIEVQLAKLNPAQRRSIITDEPVKKENILLFPKTSDHTARWPKVTRYRVRWSTVMLTIGVVIVAILMFGSFQ